MSNIFLNFIFLNFIHQISLGITEVEPLHLYQMG